MYACKVGKFVQILKISSSFGIGSVYIQRKARADIFALLNVIFLYLGRPSEAVSPN
jgi:hypothetical protein